MAYFGANATHDCGGGCTLVSCGEVAEFDCSKMFGQRIVCALSSHVM